MSERLRHLQRQQFLLREHLSWIDAEIAKETSSPEIETTRPAAWQPTPTHRTDPIDADALIERYAEKERQRPADIRRGCLLLFAGTMMLLLLSVLGVWWRYYH